ncbi:MAG: hypothetical protein RL240_1946 [Planctomycetota bacterium]|jgi:type I restriction enzyme S subunit
MVVKKGYKQTEVGVIPEDWEVRPFMSIVNIANGQVDPKRDPYRSMVLVAPDHIESKTGRLISKSSAAEQRAISGKYLFSPNEVIYSKIRPYLRKATLVDFEGLCSADMYPLKAATDVSPGYLLALILGNHFSVYAESVSVRSGMPKINRDELALYIAALPTLAEQEAIASALSDADTWIESLEQLIDKKRQIKQGAMQELLTGKRRLPGFSGEWETKMLGEIADIKTGPFGSSLHERDYVSIGTPIITVEHLGEFGVKHLDLPLVSEYDRQRLRAYTLALGDIVFSRVGSIDRNALIKPTEIGWLFSGRLLRVRPRSFKTYSPYLSYQFHSEAFIASVRNVAVGQTMACLNTQILKGIEVVLPEIDEQTAIATVLSDMDTEIESLESKLAKAREIKQGMMQELLTGRIRLV